MTDVYTRDTSDIKMPKPTPGGRWLAVWEKHGTRVNEKGTRLIETEFALKAPLDSQDTDGVDFSLTKVYHTFYVSDKSAPYVVQDYKVINPSLPAGGMSLADMTEVMPGTAVIIDTFLETHNKAGGQLRFPRLRIKDNGGFASAT